MIHLDPLPLPSQTRGAPADRWFCALCLLYRIQAEVGTCLGTCLGTYLCIICLDDGILV